MTIARRVFIFSLIAVWALASALTFWWYQFRYYTNYSGSTVIFEAQHLAFPAVFGRSKAIKLVHFWRRDCFCDGPASEHLDDILRPYSPAELELYVLANEAPPDTWLAREYIFLSADDYPEFAATVPSSPGLAIWSADNQLVYFGPYSVGPICSQETSFVPGVLASLNLGEAVPMTSQVGSGCFCPWEAINNA